jgi:hypothetical protein
MQPFYASIKWLHLMLFLAFYSIVCFSLHLLHKMQKMQGKGKGIAYHGKALGVPEKKIYQNLTELTRC